MPETTMHSWCVVTPYPDTCTHHISHITPSQERLSMQQMSIQVAMDHAMLSGNQIILLGTERGDRRGRAAWSDCADLYDSTVRQLNRSLVRAAGSVDDVQTWLSAALTNLDTCRTGLAELNVSSPPSFLPLLTNNVSRLISNSLAVMERRAAAAEEKQEKYGGGDFPAWTSAEDRELLGESLSDVKADLVVAKDGTGDFLNIAEAIEEASRRSGSGSSRRFVIHVKAGVYLENVQVGLSDLMLVGDGIGKTVVTGSRSVGGGSTTFNSATVAVTGDGFMARGITFRNTAGPANYQAVALRCNADRSVFYRCGFEGYQDTLYAHSFRQFYRECDVDGTVDFVFGNAAAVLQACNIYVRRPMGKQQNTITAQGRTDLGQSTGIAVQDCRVTAAPELRAVHGSFRTYLGRPWKEYSRTVFIESYLDSLISAAGWVEWSGSFALKTLYYGEYKNTGPGSDTSRRVKWRGYHVITDSSTALKFTVNGLISGAKWLPSAGVPFAGGL